MREAIEMDGDTNTRPISEGGTKGNTHQRPEGPKPAASARPENKPSSGSTNNGNQTDSPSVVETGMKEVVATYVLSREEAAECIAKYIAITRCPELGVTGYNVRVDLSVTNGVAQLDSVEVKLLR